MRTIVEVPIINVSDPKHPNIVKIYLDKNNGVYDIEPRIHFSEFYGRQLTEDNLYHFTNVAYEYFNK